MCLGLQVFINLWKRVHRFPGVGGWGGGGGETLGLVIVGSRVNILGIQSSLPGTFGTRVAKLPPLGHLAVCISVAILWIRSIIYVMLLD